MIVKNYEIHSLLNSDNIRFCDDCYKKLINLPSMNRFEGIKNKSISLRNKIVIYNFKQDDNFVINLKSDLNASKYS